MHGCQGILRAVCVEGACVESGREATGVCMGVKPTRGRGRVVKGMHVGVKGMCVSIVGMGEDMHVGHESSVGVSQQKQKNQSNHIPNGTKRWARWAWGS